MNVLSLFFYHVLTHFCMALAWHGGNTNIITTHISHSKASLQPLRHHVSTSYHISSAAKYLQVQLPHLHFLAQKKHINWIQSFNNTSL